MKQLQNRAERSVSKYIIDDISHGKVLAPPFLFPFFFVIDLNDTFKIQLELHRLGVHFIFGQNDKSITNLEYAAYLNDSLFDDFSKHSIE